MFKSLLTAAALMALMLGATIVASEAAETKSALAGDELRKAINGKTVYLKISGFDLPIRYAAGGAMSGSMSTVMTALARGDGASDPWQMVDRGQPALPALERLDGRQVILL
ncbi:MAG: hypothetical protein ACR2GC_08175 [Methyloceanibacter sp.]|uniref:hypothetical protein n=1 Tax=Methyloceanibacter sp. TaxID=1965321 RepID=UPI003D9BF068